jgi:hypothetical protein
VVNTRAGSRYGNNDYVNSGCGMGYDATMYLLERGIRLTGTDAWSWDAPFYFTAQKWAKDHDPRSSGKATRPAATSATAISRSCTISRRCRRRLHHRLLPAQDPRRLGRLDRGGRDLRGVSSSSERFGLARAGSGISNTLSVIEHQHVVAADAHQIDHARPRRRPSTGALVVDPARRGWFEILG